MILLSIHTHTHTPHPSSVHFFMLILRWLLLMCRFYFISYFLFFLHFPHLPFSPSILVLRSKQTKWIGNMIHLYYPFYGATNNEIFPWQKELHNLCDAVRLPKIYTQFSYFCFPPQAPFPLKPPPRVALHFFNALFFFRIRRKFVGFFFIFLWKSNLKNFHIMCVCV